MVSPRPISVCAISTGIAPEQKTAEKTPWAARDMVRMLRRQMLRTCAREDQSGVLPPGKRREETPLKMASKASRARTRRKFGAVRTWQEKEGSEETQPDVGALQRQIQELLDEKQQTLEKDERTRLELDNNQTTIGRMREEIHGLRRTIAGSGFSLGRLKREVDEARKGNQELKHRNHELRKELRRAGRKLLDLGN